jgi:spermidine synthase
MPLLILLALFAGSGCTALIYEIVWFQLLQLVIGSTAVSLAVLLATFMGGLCLGSVAFPRYMDARRHPLLIYAGLELAIGLLGIGLFFVVPGVDRLYVLAVEVGLGGVWMRAIVCGICLLPPTVLMGATFPAVARWLDTTPAGVCWIGIFYGGNIAGAVFGCLVAGFFLLRVFDLAAATYAAASANLVIAAAAFLLARVAPARAQNRSEGMAQPEGAADARWVYIAIACSGACALAAEVIWTRLLALLLGATVYTFAIILAVFLIGLGLGSGVGSLLARAAKQPRKLLAACQVLAAATIAWAAYALCVSLPFWPVNPYLATDPWVVFQFDLVRCMYAILPAAFFWGASFPIALAAIARRGQDGGQLAARAYAANTLGAIVGAVIAATVLVPVFGSQFSQQLLISLSAFAGFVLLLAPRAPVATEASTHQTRARPLAAVWPVSALVLPVLAALSVPAVPWELIAFGRLLPNHFQQNRNAPWTLLYVGEGQNMSVAVSQTPAGVNYFHVSGKVEASGEPEDMRLQRMLGHLPALVHPRPRSVLVVGCGAGVTAGSFVAHPEIERIVICDLEPLVPRRVAPFFSTENHNVVKDPRVEIVYDDARHYILTTREKFDIITSDPIHPWVKGSATLYTAEYFELCKQHLNPGGVMTQWVPLYDSSLSVVQSEMATFFQVFPHGTLWNNDKNGEGYDTVLLGQAGSTVIDVDALHKRLEKPDQAAVAKSLEAVGFPSEIKLLMTFAGRADDLKPWLAQAEINRDSNLRLQFQAGLGNTANEGKKIQQEFLAYRRVPDDLFIGDGFAARAFRWAMAGKFGKR